MNRGYIVHKVSKIFQPFIATTKNAVKNPDITSNSQRLMIELGIIRPACLGCFHLLPLANRSIEKLIHLIDREMASLNAQKITLSYFTNANLWKKTGRLNDTENELFTVQDRHKKKYVLSPTYEESISDLIASIPQLTYRNLPLRLYQITSKFRDEMRPRYGLMRSKQFLMKDLYTFDANIDKAKETYDEVCLAYDKIFAQLGINFHKVLGVTGNIGGLQSHEYHFPSEFGEDKLLICSNCQYQSNKLLCDENIDSCPQCHNKEAINFTPGIEVGHTFLLGERYSAPLKAIFIENNGKSMNLQMGSYGLGVSRILAASLEVLSNEHELRWPLCIAPYKAIIIPPKEGSHEEQQVSHFIEKLYHSLNSMVSLHDDIIIDDRRKITIGKKLLEAKRTGYPFIVVIGKHATKDVPEFELFDLSNNSVKIMTESDIIEYIKNKVNSV